MQQATWFCRRFKCSRPPPPRRFKTRLRIQVQQATWFCRRFKCSRPPPRRFKTRLRIQTKCSRPPGFTGDSSAAGHPQHRKRAHFKNKVALALSSFRYYSHTEGLAQVTHCLHCSEGVDNQAHPQPVQEMSELRSCGTFPSPRTHPSIPMDTSPWTL